MEFFEKWWVKENPYLKSFYSAAEQQPFKNKIFKSKGETSMAKFKVGDKVRVKKDLVGNNYYPRPDGSTLRFAFDMERYRDQIYTIRSIDSNGDYTLEGVKCFSFLSSNYWEFCDSMLEPVSVGFTKADLKDGMVVETKGGKRYVVMGDKFMDYNSYYPLTNYGDDLVPICYLSREFKEDKTIVKVYKSDAKFLRYYFDSDCLELIWERKEEEPHKEMTVAEIEEKLGYKIKVVADKEEK